MLPFPESFVAIIVALVVPALIGMLTSSGAAKSVSPRYLSAFAVGVYLWFFSDTVGGSAYLDVNAGFTGGVVQLILVGLFSLGILLFFALDRATLRPGQEITGISLAIPLLVAFAVGIHGFGEGAAFGAMAATTATSDIFTAFGGVPVAFSFLLHKAIEPVMISAAYWAYAKGHARSTGALVGDLLLLALVFSLPGIIGSATDYFLGYDTTYFFALGAGTSVYAAIRLAKPLFMDSDGTDSESLKVAFSMVLGFLSIYFAALFH